MADPVPTLLQRPGGLVGVILPSQREHVGDIFHEYRKGLPDPRKLHELPEEAVPRVTTSIRSSEARELGPADPREALARWAPDEDVGAVSSLQYVSLRRGRGKVQPSGHAWRCLWLQEGEVSREGAQRRLIHIGACDDLAARGMEAKG